MINIWLLYSWPLPPGHRENCGSCLNLVSPPDFLSLRWMELSLSRKEKMAEYRYLFIQNILCICICNRVACDSNKCVFGNQRIVYPILSRSLMTLQEPKSSYDKPEGRTSTRQKTQTNRKGFRRAHGGDPACDTCIPRPKRVVDQKVWANHLDVGRL